ncbi:siphovirus Gp157 family protein [Cyanobacterium aponinum]|uniref:siphovirus Gp157 family protein n=1 Tax=Cyanobacterium aponinum TaxID=379064 RepID=UPI000C12B081|nr:siphovirus Gp157 family protein [Cyanobacterium aponinum]PHV61066.1 hypothetical protein CSQ80_17555 [Cyanobacterium aponinum IPPAS B-1201]
MKLWELSQDIEMLESAIAQIEDDPNISDKEKEELLKDVYSQWLETEENFEEKALNTASYIRHLEAVTNARKEEIKRLQALAKQSENQMNRLKTYLAEHMKRTEKTKIEGTTGKLSLRKKPKQLVISCDVEDLPEEYCKVTIEPDKTKIKQFIKEHGDLTFAQMKDFEDYSLIIK